MTKHEVIINELITIITEEEQMQNSWYKTYDFLEYYLYHVHPHIPKNAYTQLIDQAYKTYQKKEVI